MNDLIRQELKGLLPAEFRDDIMVVGIEPFGHFHGGHVDSPVLVSSGHGEVEVKVASGLIEQDVLVSFRNGSHGKGHIQYLVIEGEVVGGDPVDACGLLKAPVRLSDLFTGIAQLLLCDLALPELFIGFFQFSVTTNSRVAQVVRLHCKWFLMNKKALYAYDAYAGGKDQPKNTDRK